MPTLRDIARLTKQSDMRHMAAALLYAGNISARELFRVATLAAKPKVPQDLSPDGHIDSGSYYLNWTDPGNGTHHQAESFVVWLYRGNENSSQTIIVGAAPTTSSYFPADDGFVFTVRAKNAFGESKESEPSDFDTRPSAPGPSQPPSPTPSGFSSIEFTNCDSERHSLEFYLLDLTAQIDWTSEGQLAAQYDDSGMCNPATANPLRVALTEGHNYYWRVYDPAATEDRIPQSGPISCSSSGPVLRVNFPGGVTHG